MKNGELVFWPTSVGAGPKPLPFTVTVSAWPIPEVWIEVILGTPLSRETSPPHAAALPIVSL